MPDAAKTQQQLLAELSELRERVSQLERERAEDELREAHARLEARVEERTAELAAANRRLSDEIAERRQTETALVENEEKYRRLFENELFAICIFDLETLRFIDINDAHVSLYGYSREELMNSMIAPDLSAQHQTADRRTRRARPVRW